METVERTPRPEKVAVVQDVETRLGESNAAILTEYRGVSVADLERLRRALTAVGGDYKVYKNTLVRRAAQTAGVESITPLLVGPTGIAFVSGDVSAVAKVLRDFSRENANLVVKGGLIGKDLIDAKGTAALAELPSREVLLAEIAGLLAAPMQHFASLLNAVPQKLAYGLSALIDSLGGAPAEAPAVEEAVTAGEPPAAPAAEAPAEEASAEEAPAPEAAAEATESSEAPAPEAAAEATESSEAPAEEPAGE